VLAVGDAQLADWEAIGDDPEHAELTVLTACRVWRYADEGHHCAKTAAGEWANGGGPTLQVVRDALHQRHHNPTAPIDPAQVAQLLAVIRARWTRHATPEGDRPSPPPGKPCSHARL
jgi:hypothetical protein